MKFPVRYFVIFITFLANVSIPLCTRNIVFALQPMVNHSAIKTDEPRDYQSESCHPLDMDTASRINEKPQKDGIYTFSEETQAHILGDPFIAQVIGTGIAIYIFDMGYERNIYALCLLWSGLLNVLLPVIAYYGGSVGIITSRIAIGFYTGVMTPTNYMTARSWALPSEWDIAIAFMYAGGSVGSVLFALAGEVTDSIGWEYLFYIPGAFQILISMLVAIFSLDDPTESPFLSVEEKILLGKKPSEETSNQCKTVYSITRYIINKVVTLYRLRRTVIRDTGKWYKALKSMKYWAILVATFGYYWSSEGILVYTVNYLHDMHGFSDRQIAIYSSLPTNISMFILSLVAPFLAGILVEKKWIGKVSIRRIGAILCSLAGLPFILMGTLPCATIEDSIVPILILSCIRGGWYISITPTINDLQRDYQNQLVTFSILIGGIPGFLVPRMMTFVGTTTRHEWLIIFAIATAVIFVSFFVFIYVVDTKEERYDDEIQDHDPNVDDIASEIEDVVTAGEDNLDSEIEVVKVERNDPNVDDDIATAIEDVVTEGEDKIEMVKVE